MYAYADLRSPPEFSSTTQIYIMDKADGSTKYQLDISDFQSSTYLTKDYMALIKSEPVMDQVISDLNLDMKAELPKMDMSNLDMKDETPDMRMANLDMTEEDVLMQMAGKGWPTEVKNELSSGSVPESETTAKAFIWRQL